MKISSISLFAGFALLTTAVSSSVGIQIFGSGSFGVLFVSAVYLYLFVTLRVVHGKIQNLRMTVSLIASVLGLIAIQGVATSQIHDQFDLPRFLQSYALLIFCLSGAFSFILLVRRLSECRADFAVKFVFYVLLLSSVAGFFRYSPFSTSFRRPVLFFSEPSHFALGFSPFLLYVAVRAGPKMRLLWISLAYVIALFLQNFTLVLASSLVTLLVLPLRRLMFLAPIVAIVIFVTSADLDYYTSRTEFSESGTNLSSLVYLSGWERAYQNLKETSGLGVGFQQFGIVGSRGSVMEQLALLNAEDLNLLDGGSVASKLIGELGMLGVCLMFVYLVYFVKNFMWFRALILRRRASPDSKQIFFCSCFLIFSIDFFVRGVGYFSSEGFMFLASMIWMLLGERVKSASDNKHAVLVA